MATKEMEQYESQLRDFLKGLSVWQQTVDRRLQDLGKGMVRLEKLTLEVGKACGEAFRRTKVVIEHLTEAVDDTRQDLSEYGGTITASTWDVNGC